MEEALGSFDTFDEEDDPLYQLLGLDPSTDIIQIIIDEDDGYCD